MAVLGVAWVLCWAFGAQIAQTPIASTSAASVVVNQVSALRADIADHGVFAKEISHEPMNSPQGESRSYSSGARPVVR